MIYEVVWYAVNSPADSCCTSKHLSLACTMDP